MSATPRADFWFSIVLIAFGGGVVFESWRMPRLANLGIDPLSAPGLTPGLLGLVILGLGAAILLRSLGRTPRPEKASPAGWGKLSAALALCLAYAVVLIGRVEFWIATALFVFAFSLVFSESGSLPRRAALAGLLAVATAVAVTLLFERVFLIRLP